MKKWDWEPVCIGLWLGITILFCVVWGIAINKVQGATHGTTIGVKHPDTCHAALCIGEEGWGLDVDDVAVYQDETNKSIHIYPNEDDGIGWADDDNKELTSGAVFSSGDFYVEPEYGVKLIVKYVHNPDGTVEHDIYAMPDKKEIYGDTNKRAAALARSADSIAANAGHPGYTGK